MRVFKALCVSSMLLVGTSAFGDYIAPSPRRLAVAPYDAGNTTTPLPPSKDPWYTAPDGYLSAKPGTIFRMREAPGNLTNKFGNARAAYNILYATTNSLYNADWAVTTVIVPKAADIDSLLSYQIPYDSAFVDASPSYALYQGPPSDINVALGSGWLVNVPDYEGPLASFTAGVQSGHATLDSVRAVLSTASTYGLSSTAKYAMWGYSGGALASEWASELQGDYAPELSFAGSALGGLTPNITSVLFTINKTLYVGLAPSGILGISSQFPELRQFILNNLKQTGQYNATGFLAAENLTLIGSIGRYANQDMGAYFINGLSTISDPIATKYTTRDGIMGLHGTPKMPVFAYKAIMDQISVIADTDNLIDKYCDAGANILYQRNTVGGHQAEGVNGTPRAVAFLTSVFAGNFTQTGCVIQNVTVAITNSPL